MQMPWPARVLLGAIALGLTYAGIFKLILIGSSFGASVGATFWPASGVTVSVLILRRRREWPFYLVAIWLADFLMDTHGVGYSVRVSLGIATANCAEPLASATLLRRWLRARPDLSNGRDLGVFYLAAAGCGPLLSAIVASGWQWILGTNPVWPFLGRWYVGDALGVTVIAPVILSCVQNRARPKPSEGGTLLALLLIVAAVMTAPFAARDGLPFLVIAAMSVVAIRMRTRAAAVAVFVIGVTVELLTAVGSGPFAGKGPFTGLLAAQMYMVACSVSGLTAAALMSGLLRRDRMALHDSLTGLANRRLLMDRTSLSLDQIARSREALGLVFIDLDGFKAVNDVHGHGVGDRVLVEIARRLQSVVNQRDTIARIGGDEFVILVDRAAKPATMSALVERVERVVAEPIDCRGVGVRIGASVGYTICDKQDERPEDVLGRADDAMYGVKRARTASCAAAVPFAGLS
jgi:diguanylate cyclase (GGDEF)-like protein